MRFRNDTILAGNVAYITYSANSKHWFTTSFLGGRCRKAMLGVCLLWSVLASKLVISQLSPDTASLIVAATPGHVVSEPLSAGIAAA